MILIKAGLAFFGSFLIPLRKSYIKLVFEQEKLTEMISLLAISAQVAYLIGPMLGTYIYESLGSWLILVHFDLYSFIIGSLIILFIPDDNTSVLVSIKSKMRDLKGDFVFGLKYSWKNLKIRFIVIQNIYHDFYNGYLLPLMLPFIKIHLQLGETHLGQVYMGYGLGSILGSFIGNTIVTRKRIYLDYKVFILFEAVVGIIWILTENQILSVLGMFFWGVTASVVYLLKTSVFMENADDKVLNRVMSMHDLTRVGGSILGSLFLFLVGDLFTAFNILIVSAIVTLALDTLTILSPIGRNFSKK